MPLNFINGINERFLIYVNQEKHLYRYRLAKALIEIGLNYQLIARYPASGAAISSLTRGLFCFAWFIRLFQADPTFQPFAIFPRDLGNYPVTYGPPPKGMATKSWQTEKIKYPLSSKMKKLIKEIEALPEHQRYLIEEMMMQFLRSFSK